MFEMLDETYYHFTEFIVCSSIMAWYYADPLSKVKWNHVKHTIETFKFRRYDDHQVDPVFLETIANTKSPVPTDLSKCTNITSEIYINYNQNQNMHKYMMSAYDSFYDSFYDSASEWMQEELVIDELTKEYLKINDSKIELCFRSDRNSASAVSDAQIYFHKIMCLLFAATKKIYPSFVQPEKYIFHTYFRGALNHTDYIWKVKIQTREDLCCLSHVMKSYCKMETCENKEFKITCEYVGGKTETENEHKKRYITADGLHNDFIAKDKTSNCCVIC